MYSTPGADSLRTPRAVLFDLDGTLVDSLGDLVLATDATLEEFGLPPAGEAHVRRWVGRGIDALVAQALRWAQAEDEDTRQRALTAFASHYAAANGRTTRALPGAAPLLEWLGGQGLPVALVTNKSRRFALQLLDGLGWRAHFRSIVCGDDAPAKKPAAAPVLQALRELASGAEEAVMVGDSTYDVRAAHAAGVAAIRLAEGYGPAPSDDDVTAQWEGATLEAVLGWLQATCVRTG